MEAPQDPATPQASELEGLANDLIARSYRPSTILNYKHRVRNFALFLEGLKVSRRMPIPSYHVALYLAYLSKEGYAPGTLKLALSAISWYHKMSGAPDPTTAPAIQRMIIGAKEKAPPPKKLHPISRSILHAMVAQVPFLPLSDYMQKLTKALLLLGYHACARVGELLVSSNADHTLKMENIHFSHEEGKISFRFTLPSYKHSKEEASFVLEPAYDQAWCPVRHLISFLKERGTGPGYLFLSTEGHPIKREFLANQIQALAGRLGLEKEKYNTHSLRIGRTTDMAAEGESEATIKQTGRWHSSAHLDYVRCPAFVLPQ